MDGVGPGEIHELVLSAQRGDARAFEHLVRLMQDAAVAYAWGILRDRTRAEDAAQEGFLEAYLKLAELRDPGAFPSWLRAIVFSKCTRMMRRKNRLSVLGVHANEESASAPDPMELHARAEARREIVQAVDALPPNERAVVTLFYMAELDQASIGSFLSVPISTVKNRLSSARQRLKGILMKELSQQLQEQRPSRDESFQRRVALFRAVDANDVGTVERLLRQDPSLVHERRRRDEEPPPGVRWGVTPLHVACSKGWLRLAELLIDAGADLEARASGNDDRVGGGTALHWAACQKARYR
jgi:RNA polymerase sigma-70 factor (ECF subfamily)